MLPRDSSADTEVREADVVCSCTGRGEGLRSQACSDSGQHPRVQVHLLLAHDGQDIVRRRYTIAKGCFFRGLCLCGAGRSTFSLRRVAGKTCHDTQTSSCMCNILVSKEICGGAGRWVQKLCLDIVQCCALLSALCALFEYIWTDIMMVLVPAKEM